MPLPWVRLDTTFFDHPKVLGLVGEGKHRAIVVHLAAMTYAGKHGTDGFIPREALAFLHGRQADARDLVNAGLWAENGGGWDINGWDEYQISDENSRKRRDKAKAAAAVRWSRQQIRGVK